MTLTSRFREIVDAIRSAKFPQPPRRRYDLIGEAMARPFGGIAGRGRIRDGAITDDDKNERC
jgi:hypothetical protein